MAENERMTGGAKVERVALADLVSDPANLRRRDERAKAGLLASLRRFGPARSLVIDGKDIVRAGNGTLEAAIAAGCTEALIVTPEPGQVVAVRRGDWSATEGVAYSVGDNRTSDLSAFDDAGLAETLRALQSEDFDLSAVGFTDVEVDDLCKAIGDGLVSGSPAEDPGAQVDRAEELLAKWKVDPGQLWEVSSKATPGKCHRLLCGDSTKPEDVARVMGGEKAVLIVTDPPYGVDFVRGQYISDPSRKASTSVPLSIIGDNRKGDEQRAFIEAVFGTYRPHVEDAAGVYMFSACLVEGCCSFFGMLDAGVKVQSQLIWNKNVHCLGRADYHWKHEVCWYGWYEGGAHRWYGGRDKFTMIDCARVASTLHPNEKPTDIIAGFLENSSLQGDIVAEPFSGSGTTLVASEQCGRLCRAMELDPKFVAVALERLSGMGLEPRPR